MGLVHLAHGIDDLFRVRAVSGGRLLQFLLLLARGQQAGEYLVRGRKRNINCQRRGPLDLGLQPRSRVGGRRRQIAGFGTQAETQNGNLSEHHAPSTAQPARG